MGDPGPALVSFVRRNAAKPLFAALVLALVLASAGPRAAGGDAIETHKRDLADVEGRVQDLEQDLGTRRGRREVLLADLEQRERNIADLARAGHQLASMVSEQERALQGLRSRLAVERDALDRERDALAT